MNTSETPMFRRAVSLTLCLCLTATGAFAQKPRAPAPAAPPPPPSASTTTPAPKAPPLSDALTGQAKADYDAAKLLYEDGDFAGAGLKFKQAFDASKDVRLLWNMAACEKNLRHYGKVYKLVEKYLALGQSTLPEQERKDAAAFLDAMKAFIGRLKISVSEPDATIYVDDEAVGTSPLMDPILADMGSRKIRVSKPGFTDFAETLEVAGASDVPLAVKLVKESHEGRIAVTAADDNLVYLDGKLVGQGRWEGVAGAGTHTVRVTAPGMKPFQTEIMLADKENRSLQISLDPEAKKEGSSALWWIVGGVAAAGAAGGIVYFATRGKDSSGSPGTVVGTIQPGSIQLVLRQRWPQ